MQKSINKLFNITSMQLVYELIKNLNKKLKVKLLILFIFMVLNGIVEGLSIALIYSFLSILTDPLSIKSNSFVIFISKYLYITDTNNILILFTVLIVIVFNLSGLFKLVNLWKNSMISESIGTYYATIILRNTLYQNYLYHSNKASNEIINAATFCTRVGSSSINYSIQLISALILSSSIVLTIIYVNASISISIIFSVSSIYLLIGLSSNKRIKKNGIIQLNLSNKQIEIIQVSLNNIKEILLSSNQGYFLKDYKKTDKKLREKFGETRFLAFFPKIVVETLVFSLVAILSYLIFIMGQSNLYLLPIIGTILLSLQKLLPYTQQIFASWSQINNSEESLKTILYYLKLNKREHELTFPIKPLSFEREIKLNNISFSYSNNQKNIIKNFSLSIKKGSRIGVKGETGKGKSTFINILMGLIIPSKGEFIIDGFNLYKGKVNHNLARWGAGISHVSQEINLINKNFISNIAFGVEENRVDLKRVKYAARVAGIESFINSREDGFYSNVGEGGMLISGGQRQRIGIARAIYKNLDFLVLDEATSALDTKTEEKILNSIFSLENKITIIMISHKLKTLERCDKIIEI